VSSRGNFTPRTGSPEAVTRLWLPRNVACRFPALRSSKIDSQHSECCYSFKSRFHNWHLFSLHRRPSPPFVWSLCFPKTIPSSLAASLCDRLSRPRSTISQSDFRQAVGSSLLYRLVGSLLHPTEAGNLTDLPCSHEILCLHAGGTTPEAPQDTCPGAPCDSAFPLERQGRLLPSRSISGLFLRSLPFSSLQTPCLRFAGTVASHHARLGTQLLAKLYCGRHLRRLYLMRLQGATLLEPDVSLSTHPAPTDQPYGFALLSGSSHKMVDHIVKPVDATSSLHLHYKDFNTTTDCPVPLGRIGTVAPVESPLGFLS